MIRTIFYIAISFNLLYSNIEVVKINNKSFLEDVFYEFYKNDCITITGTNGKSTTCKLLYEVLMVVTK